MPQQQLEQRSQSQPTQQSYQIEQPIKKQKYNPEELYDPNNPTN